MQLLSASEKNALQSFLSIMDYSDDTLTANEWALLSSGTPLSSPDFFVDPNPEHKEALAKATKDLMSLEPDRWRSQSALQSAVDIRADHNHHPHQHLRGFQQQQASIHQFQHFQQRRPMLGSSLSYPQAKSQMHYPGQHPSLAMNGVQGPSSSSSTGMVQQLMDPSYDGLLGTPMGQSQSASSSSSRHTLQPSSSSSSATTTTTTTSSQRITRHASNTSSLKRKRKSTSPSSSATPSTTPTPKQTLLSPSQKKANHIQSEQKRRANIRRGYEALCETVPALREAIRQEEEEAAMMAEKNSTSATGRRRRKKGGTGEEKDRIDGRAGPRSENVVLTKTIEHIQNMLSDRSALLSRLHHAQSMLPLGHPVSCPLQADPPWEREWKGGEGRAIGSVDGDGDEDVGSGSDGDDGDE